MKNTIIDLYDVINDGFTGQTEKNLMAERYVLEHADGIVWRWFSKAYLEEKGFKYQGKSIQFIDYCDYKGEDSFSYEADHTALKLCTITGYGDEYAEERPYVTEYAEWARLDEILARVGNKEDCIFHFYFYYYFCPLTVSPPWFKKVNQRMILQRIIKHFLNALFAV